MNISLLGYNCILSKKNVKRINIKIYPDCSIKISAPEDITIDKLEKVIYKKKKRIDSQLIKFKQQERLLEREYVSGEDHYVNGKRYILEVIDSKNPKIELVGFKTMKMFIQKNSSKQNKEKCLYNFYSNLLNEKINYYIPILEEKIGVKCNGFKIRKMKNKWACCNPSNGIVTFNVELATKSDNEIKYVITHELVHFIEKTHNERFISLMNEHSPNWRKNNERINTIIKQKKK